MFTLLPDLAPGPPLQTGGVEVPAFPALAALAGGGVLLFFLLQAVRPRRPARRRHAVAVEATAPFPVAASAVPTPPPAPTLFKKAPIAILFPQVRAEFPDVWGVGDPFEVGLRVDDRTLAEFRQIPGLVVHLDGQHVAPAFARGAATIRHVFRTLGEKTVEVELGVKGESLPRKTQRTVKVVEYRAEIAEVFSNFREEASRAITPIREDATPWEIFDLLSEANVKLPTAKLREIITSFEEAKFSNHSVTRATYERMINALLMLERVEL